MEKVSREYAEWLSKPRRIDASISAKVPIGDLKFLSSQVRRNLLDSGITELYPVQYNLIPFIVESDYGANATDICCSAPTGSGKTLAYTIPLVEMLQRTICERSVAALVVMPVKDLAEQVASVIRRIARDTNVHCSLLSGDSSYEDECTELGMIDWQTAAERQNSNVLFATAQSTDVPNNMHSTSDALAANEESLARCSRQTIVVCTPSRLLLHLHRNAPFRKALRLLGYLIIDEADRVLHDAVRSGWLTALEHAVGIDRFAHAAASWRLGCSPSVYSSHRPLRKLLFSATFTRNPELLHAVRMCKPVLFAAQAKLIQTKKAVEPAQPKETELKNTEEDMPSRYIAPAGLREYFVASTPELKPLALFVLLRTKLRKLCADAGDVKSDNQNAANANQKRASVLCFANSRESSHRLAHVLSKLGGDKFIVTELSARLPTAKRRRILAQLSRSEIDVVVCTDAMARGMDISNVRCVVSYDMPPHGKTYVHRCGRTARAGQSGTAISMLHRSQVHAFKKMLGEISGGGFGSSIREEKLPEQRLRPFHKVYQESLRSLRQTVRAPRAAAAARESDATKDAASGTSHGTKTPNSSGSKQQ